MNARLIHTGQGVNEREKGGNMRNGLNYSPGLAALTSVRLSVQNSM